MADIRVHVQVPGGDSHSIETPVDIKTEDFVRELVAGLNLPQVDAEGHQVTWRLDNKDTGKMLEYPQSLEQSGVRDGHHLYLNRKVVAGSEN